MYLLDTFIKDDWAIMYVFVTFLPVVCIGCMALILYLIKKN